MALNDLQYMLRITNVTEAGQADRHEADFKIGTKPEDGAVPMTLDDIAASVAFLKTQKGVPGTALVGAPVDFPLRW